jgi:hypothetical protein
MPNCSSSSASDTFSISLSDICNNMSSSSTKSVNRYYTTSSTCNSSSSSSSYSKHDSSSSCGNTTVDSSSSCASSSSSLCPKSSSSSSCHKSSSSSSCGCDKSSSSSSCGCDKSSSSSGCDKSSSSSSCKSNPCVDTKCECKEVSKAYEKNRKCIKANNEANVILEFIYSKIKESFPVVGGRDMSEYNIFQNIAWVESYIDRILCVVTQNNVCKSVKVTVCKHKNDLENVGDRVYTITMKFGGGVPDKVVEMSFHWRHINLNIPAAYVAVIIESIRTLSLTITSLKAQNAAFVFFA